MAKPKSSKSSNRRTGRFKRLVYRSFFLLLVFGLAAVLVAKYVLIPPIVEGEIRKQLSPWWDGPIEIEKVEVNFLRPSRVYGVRLSDKQGRCWVSLDSAEVKVSGILALDPTVSELTLERLVVTAHFKNGQCSWPKPASEPREPDTVDEAVTELDPADLPDIQLRDAAIVLREEDGWEWTWDNINLQTRWLDGKAAMELRLSRFSESGRDKLSLEGSIHPETFEADLKLALAHTISRDETAVILDALDVPAVTDAEGVLMADVSIRGRLNDSSSLQLRGTVNVIDLTCRSGADEINSDMDIGIRFTGREAQIAYANLITPVFTLSLGEAPLAYKDHKIVARLGDTKMRFPKREEYGPFWGNALGLVRIEGWVSLNGTVVFPTRPGDRLLNMLQGRAELKRLALPVSGLLELTDLNVPEFVVCDTELRIPQLSCRTWGGQANGQADLNIHPFTYEVLADVKSLEAGRVIHTFDPSAKMRKGTIFGRLALGGSGFTSAGFHLNALLMAENVDVEVNPLFFDIFSALDVRPASARGTTDLAAAFHMDYPILTIDKARLANRSSAMIIEPDGTMDLKTGQLDFYVVGGRLDNIRLGLLRPAKKFSTQLRRLRVRGNWADPPEALIHKELLADLAGGTVGFFSECIKVGGDFGQEILHFFGPSPSDAEAEKPQPSESRP
jgi:hypothetical protein